MSDASAPGLSADVSGINQRMAASITERASRTIKTNCSGAGAKVTRIPAPSVPADNPAKAVTLFSIGARSRSVSRMVAPSVVAASPVAKPCTARATMRAAAEPAVMNIDHRGDVHPQGAKNCRPSSEKVRERSHRQERQQKAQHVRGEYHGDHERRQAEVALVLLIKRRRRRAARREGHRREHGEDRRDVARQRSALRRRRWS